MLIRGQEFMPTEFAASFPRDAERSLRGVKAFYGRLLRRKVTDSDAWIEVLEKHSTGLIEWEIQISEAVKDSAAARKEHIIESLASPALKQAVPILQSNPIAMLNAQPGQFPDDWWSFEVCTRNPYERLFEGSCPASDLERVRLFL